MAGNSAKKKSKTNGALFLRSAFSAEEEVLALQIELSSSSITHSGVAGAINERHFIDFLRRYLPKRYEVDTAIVIDSDGRSSDQIDVVIFDNQYTPNTARPEEPQVRSRRGRLRSNRGQTND